MFTLQEATAADLDFLIQIDLKDEGCTSTYRDGWGPQERAEHRAKIAAFLSDDDKTAWAYEDTETGRTVGVILWRYRNRLRETFEGWSIFPQLDERLFPADGAFCEIFQLWVSPEHRRRGLASRLKRQAERDS